MPDEAAITVRAVRDDERNWMASTLARDWGSTQVARRGELVDAMAHPAYLVEADGQPAGLAVVAVRGDEIEVLSIGVSVRRRGAGRALMQRCASHGRETGCRRLWLTTTNDNIGAIAFYQHIGLDLCALHRDAVDEARRLKPSISTHGEGGIPIKHELEFELLLSPPRAVM
ncbi:MAG TPA: GNAT family N-acetyltransferase [Nocardioidaceae bacterium]|nr:GNAT family N-acetyltransferase [Nocardioidaceae bacterium]